MGNSPSFKILCTNFTIVNILKISKKIPVKFRIFLSRQYAKLLQFFYVTFLLYKDVGGERPPTMIPTDRYVLRTLTILPNIRISWEIHPTFMLICVCRPWDPGII